MSNTLWFPGKRKPNAQFRLFCLPFGGAGANIYREWHTLFPENIDLCPIQLPGRENRIKEPVYTDLYALEKDLIPLLQPLLDLPYAFFGHSFGALVSYQLSKSLKPEHLFVSAYTSPTIANPRVAHLKAKFEEAGLLDAYNKNDFTPEQITTVIKNKIFSELNKIPPEIAPMYVKIGTADTKVLSSYHHDNTILPCSITAFYGSDDKDVSESDMMAWHSLTSKSFSIFKMAGDHLFITNKDVREKMTEIIRSILLGGRQ